MYKVLYTDDFKRDFNKLDSVIQKRVLDKIVYLARNPGLAEKLRHMPKELHGLYKYRIGDWRIYLWVYNEKQVIKLYGFDHRGKAYRKF
jgi:mRNA-degrading endonuclease RelE of RelBE toxin-antitoxin system